MAENESGASGVPSDGATTTDVPLPADGWMPLEDVLAYWRVGSGDWSWLEEAAQLIELRPTQFAALLRSVDEHGLRAPIGHEEPITLGSDGRLWSGHHRVLAAIIGRIDMVPASSPRATPATPTGATHSDQRGESE